MAGQHRRNVRAIGRVAAGLRLASAHALLLTLCYGAATATAQVMLFLRDGTYSGSACALYRGIGGGDACFAYAERLALGRDAVAYALTQVDLMLASLALAGLLTLAYLGLGAVRDRLNVGRATFSRRMSASWA
ncbi:hypothetical protein U8607_19775 [Methylobacterium durans]|uniref:hypothetical protein n=1 Tax=Methylobacterium durans TaxID=2202825 RepID=UPI002AFF2237|nr:hypothetical protein [Methylobacterium durans]MEA1834338.1 hypothetical protein [Methylobacterium durans]